MIKANVIKQTKGTSKKGNAYSVVLCSLPNGDLVNVFDMSGRDFPKDKEISLAIESNYRLEPKVVIL